MWSISDNISGWEGSYSRWYENTGIEHRLLLEWESVYRLMDLMSWLLIAFLLCY